MARVPLELVVYTKDDCPLCDEMMAALEDARSYESFTVDKVDISTDPELQERYKLEVPVLMIQGRKAFKGRAPAKALKKKLAKARSLAEKDAPLTSLDALDPPRYTPPRALAALILVATLGAFGYFVATGFSQTNQRAQDFSGTLLRVEARDTTPVPFELVDLDGRKVTLASLSNKVVFINFWATWCPPCVEEMPSIFRLHERMGKRDDFVMLLVSADEDWTPVKKFFEGDKPPFPVLLDAKGDIARQYGTTRFPETFVVVDGRIKAFIEGPRDWDTWFAEAYLRSFLRS